MEISETRAGDAVVLAVAGRLDSSTSPDLGRHLTALVERGETRLVLDFAGLEYVSSAGLAVMLAAAKKLRARNGRVDVAGVNPRIRLVFEMSGFVTLFPMHADVAAALAGARTQ